MNNLLPWIIAVLIALMGTMFIAMTPAGHIPDVWAHIYRINGILNGDVMARPVDSVSILHSTIGNVGGCVDESVLQFSIDHYDGYDTTAVPADFLQKHTPASGATCLDAPYNNTATNTPISYLPQLAAFALGRATSIGIAATYLLAEAFMLVVYVICMFIAIQVLPRWRLPMTLLLVSPLLIFRYSFAISADSMAQALCLLFACLLFSCMVDERVRGGRLLALIAVGILMSMSKFTLTPLLILGFLPLLPFKDSTEHSERHTWARATIILTGNIIGFVFLILWMRTTSWFTTTSAIVPYDMMIEKKSQLFSDPTGPNSIFSAIAAIAQAIVTGQSNLDSRSQTIIILCLWTTLAILLIMLIIATMRRIISTRMIWFCWCTYIVSIGIILLIYLAIWLQYTPISADGVDGMQFRYFLPLSGLFTLCTCECASGLLKRRSVRKNVAAQ